MAFPTGWGRKCALVIQSGQVTDNEVDFPALVTEDTLPLEIFDADGAYPALNGGGDIRFSSDSDGATQLSCEIESFITDNDPANGKAAIWVKIPSLSSTTNTTIYIWYNKAGETQPAEDATYGKEAVWDSNFVMVQHMNQDPSGSSPQMIDSTSNDNDGTSSGTMLTEDLVAGQIDGALDFDGGDDYVDTGAKITGGKSSITVSVWAKSNGHYDRKKTIAENGVFLIQTGETGLGQNDKWDFAVKTNAGWSTRLQSSAFTIGELYLLSLIYDGGDLTVYVNGTFVGTTSMGTNLASGSYFTTIGQYGGATPNGLFNGSIDEVRVSKSTRSAGWIETEYANQNSPGTFIIEGTPTSPISETPYPLNISISRSVEYGVTLSQSLEYGVTMTQSAEYGITITQSGGSS